MENNPSLRSLEYQVSSAEQGVSSARGGHYPTLGFGASYGNSESWGGTNVGSLNREGESRTIGLTLTRSEEHTSELQSLMRISYAVFCLKKTKSPTNTIKQAHNKKNNTPSTTT